MRSEILIGDHFAPRATSDSRLKPWKGYTYSPVSCVDRPCGPLAKARGAVFLTDTGIDLVTSMRRCPICSGSDIVMGTDCDWNVERHSF